MPRVLLLLTFLNAGVVAANPTAGRWNVSAFRRRAAGRRRPKMSASAAYETWTRARIDGPNFDRFVDFAGACMRGHDACRAPSDAGQCEDACRTLRWNFHARRLVERVLKVRSGSVLEEGYNWPLGSTPARPPARPSPKAVDRFLNHTHRHHVPEMGPVRGAGWFERGSAEDYLAAGGPVYLYGLQRTGSNVVSGLVSAYSGIEVAFGDEHYGLFANEYHHARANPTHVNAPTWKHFRPFQAARANATHMLDKHGAAHAQGFSNEEVASCATVSCDAKPARVAQPSLQQLHALIDGWACAASSKLCGLSKPRAVVISVRHPGAWLASITSSCPDCPSAIPGRKEGAVRRRPEFYVRTWNYFYRAWVAFADDHTGNAITFVRNEDVQRNCRRAARDLVDQLNLDWRPEEALSIACGIHNSGPSAVHMSDQRPRLHQWSVDRGLPWLIELAPNPRALRALMLADASTMRRLGYKVTTTMGRVAAAARVVEPLFPVFMDEWARFMRDAPSLTSQRRTCAPKRFGTWWLPHGAPDARIKPHCATQNLKCLGVGEERRCVPDETCARRSSRARAQMTLSRAAPFEPQNARNTSGVLKEGPRSVAFAALVGGACDRLRCHAGMMDELIDELESLNIRARYYLMAEGDAACSREWASRASYVTLVPPPSFTETNAVPWHWRGRAEFQLLNGEAARTRRFKHMALLRNLLLEEVMRRSWDAIVHVDADQGSGWHAYEIARGIDAVARGKYHSVCANGLADRSNPQRYAPHRDSLALRVADFEDQTSQGLELTAPSSAYDSGKRRVASCFGGLAAYAPEIFQNCDYAPPSNDPEGWDCEHVLLAKCIAKHGWRQWLLPNMIIHGQYAHGAASAREWDALRTLRSRARARARRRLQ